MMLMIGIALVSSGMLYCDAMRRDICDAIGTFDALLFEQFLKQAALIPSDLI